jgi:hypothetical protein
MAYDHADNHPPRPFVFTSDFPPEPTSYDAIQRTGEAQFQREIVEEYPSIQFEFARDEREELNRRALSGPQGQRWPENLGAQSPREMQRDLDRSEALRHHQGGLPDSPSMAPVAVPGGLPFVF